MRSALIFSLAVPALAYPPWLLERGLEGKELERLSHLASRIEMEAGTIASRPVGKRVIGFDASKQYVSNTGEHKFVAPGPNDLRGPCPGLNAMANHGYIPHNGVATISEFVQGTYDVFGMGTDLGAFLSIYGAVFDGDLTQWSIGGPPPGGLLSGIGLLGKPQGISRSHNKYEADVSPTRGDWYQYNNAVNVRTEQFQDLFDQPLGDNGYDIETLTEFRAKRFQQSIKGNPYFFNGAFSGIAVQPAAYTFIYRYMGNKSEEYPEGYLDGNVLKSFFAITGESGNFKYAPGNEKIPDNWYKRAIGDEYGLLGLVVDINLAALKHPEFLSVGGNTGKVDTFAGVDIGMLTKGVFDTTTLLEGNNLGCFAFQFAQQVAPDILSGLFSVIAKPLQQLNTALGSVLSALDCPQLKEVDTSQLDKFPGAKGSY